MYTSVAIKMYMSMSVCHGNLYENSGYVNTLVLRSYILIGMTIVYGFDKMVLA